MYAILKNEEFKCAFITYSDAYSEKNIKELKRHNTTDEVFILLKGNATILTYTDGNEIVKTDMEKGKAYNITKSTWHHVSVSVDAQLFVVENSNCTSENTDVMYLWIFQ